MDDIAEAVYETTGTSVETLRNHDKRDAPTNARRLFVTTARAYGCKYTQIAKYLDRAHPTIINIHQYGEKLHEWDRTVNTHISPMPWRDLVKKTERLAKRRSERRKEEGEAL